MTSLQFGLCACVLGLLATGCPADDGMDTGNDDAAMTTVPATDTGSMDSTGVMTDLSHAVDIQPIWDEHCTMACHEPDGEWGFLLDMSGNAYDAIVGVPAPQFMSLNHVEPGDLDASYLWHKINNTQASVGGSGLPMPKARAGMSATVLTADQLAMIEEWIAGGAPEWPPRPRAWGECYSRIGPSYEPVGSSRSPGSSSTTTTSTRTPSSRRACT
jgi:hypothetical protein